MSLWARLPQHLHLPRSLLNVLVAFVLRPRFLYNLHLHNCAYKTQPEVTSLLGSARRKDLQLLKGPERQQYSQFCIACLKLIQKGNSGEFAVFQTSVIAWGTRSCPQSRNPLKAQSQIMLVRVLQIFNQWIIIRGKLSRIQNSQGSVISFVCSFLLVAACPSCQAQTRYLGVLATHWHQKPHLGT